jgi:LAO/AO transport system kinase
VSADAAALAAALAAGDKAALGRAVTLCEDPRPSGAAARAALFAALPARPSSIVVGLTGAPGVGKSTLIGALATGLLVRTGRSVAVVAVDPSSPQSGGALLGDRARTRFPPDERRLFFRSQASDRQLGGLAPSTTAVTRLLARLFDRVIVETVGVGQSEIDVASLADLTIAVVQPLAGDQLQFLKAGVLEVADWLVVNKADLAGAARTAAQLSAAASIGRRPPTVFEVSARTGHGIDGLVDALADFAATPGGLADREARTFTRWVAAEYGRAGVAALAALGGGAAVLSASGSFEAAQAGFLRHFQGFLAAD